MSTPLTLRPLRPTDEAEVRLAQQELGDFDFAFGLSEGVEFRTVIDACSNQARGLNLAEGRVPATFLVAEVDGEIVGRSSIRHDLNEYLARIGGHIGYAVRPQFRRRGYATEILCQSIVIARSVGVREILVTCDDDNAGSYRAIERCGGVFESLVEREGEVAARRYWIPYS